MPQMKKVLIVTYYWAPAGGPGVQRWLKFVKYLRDFGIEPIIYTPKNPTYPMVDAHIADDLPQDLTLLRTKIWEPYGLASFFSKEKTKKISAGIIPTKKFSWVDKCLLWVRGNLFIPDARVLWVRPSVKYLSDYVTTQGIDTIITTAPPHSIHLIGLHLKEKYPTLRWIADFRDPWTNIGYHSQLRLTERSAQKHLALERKVLQSADTIIVTSPSTQREFTAKTSKPIVLITNGYDDDTFGEEVPLSPYFMLSHVGSLLSERNPETLWQVLGAMAAESPAFRQDLRICLAGKVSEEVFVTIEKYGLSSSLEYKGYLSHTDALALQRSSQLLLLLEINHPKTEGIIPGKLFEYMAAQRPILALGYSQWDVREIIAQTHTGITLLVTDAPAIKQALTHYYTLYKANQLHTQPTSLGAYHRKALTQKLSEVILERGKG
ncbi:group 1 glycosyl transferase [Capnocytophaga sp. oral taxon 338 str. F0234]|nr:group 1 glycosyl transferase [Capnocytophaga sp. oral taxon 338 str. F0234]